ncbi:MAG: hypothetical protein R2707_16985 [Acidimicrobiales bacterium]
MSDVAAVAADLDRFRASALDAHRGAAAARRLALDLDRRREVMIRRDDESRARHTDDVWSSVAASRSRAELVFHVGGWLQRSAGALRDTTMALELEARRLDSLAWSYGRQADVAEEELVRATASSPDQAALTRSVSSTSPAG